MPRPNPSKNRKPAPRPRPATAGGSVKNIAQPALRFPPAWTWFADELVPSFVKRHYSPRETWKDKPFSKEDVRFFSKGVIELSEMFTGERPGKIPAYFQHPRFRSAYLLYFLPLQMAKFVSLYQMHPKATEAALAHGRKTGTLRIADLGSGPGTASLGFLLTLLTLKESELPPAIELVWFDSNRAILKDGEALALELADNFPKLRGKVKVVTHTESWWRAADVLKGPCSLILMGHVLNEAQGPATQSRRALSSHEEGDENDDALDDQTPPPPAWESLLEHAAGGGVLVVEPASKGTSQYLSRLRDQLLQSETIPEEPTSIWGPCLHAGRCPLRVGRDWCHFSVPTQVPGQWFREISKALSSERLWLKFSYLWLASQEDRAPMSDPNFRRVISDPLGRDGSVLLCEPDRPGKIASSEELSRGDLVRVPSSRR